MLDDFMPGIDWKRLDGLADEPPDLRVAATEWLAARTEAVKEPGSREKLDRLGKAEAELAAAVRLS